MHLDSANSDSNRIVPPPNGAPLRKQPELFSLAKSLANRQWAADELRESETRYRILTEIAPDAIVTIDEHAEILSINTAAEKIFGYPASSMLGRSLKLLMPSYSTEAPHAYQQREVAGRHKNGHLIPLEVSFGAFTQGSQTLATGILHVAERPLLQDPGKRPEIDTREAQKMEAVGRLASGIAHDFNTLLTVIRGYDEMLLNSLASDSRPRVYAQESLHAAEKASALTRQLLAFIRRQVADPGPIDINPLIANLGIMLRRLIGEHVEIVILPGQNLGAVRVDPSQIEQIVMNLVVNARDAMPGGGRITIETGGSSLGEEQPGRYVSIAVTDTGHGMTQETKSRIFEPLFTTKAQGQGTGLGLATICGIVKQNHGDIRVFSEPGKGSTFKIYLPAVDEPAEPLPSAAARIIERGMETVLVAEDDPGLRVMTKELLEQLGYTVLIAECSQEAIRIASLHPGPIHLLLTDVVMPKANGHELAEKLGQVRRQTRVLFMSGYPSEAAGQGVNVLEKPFTLEALAGKVREALDA